VRRGDRDVLSFLLIYEVKTVLARTFLPLLSCALLAACSQDQGSSATVQTAAAQPGASAAPATPAQADDPGEKTYKQACALCHGTGAGGAPMLTDRSDWEPRIAQGKDVLYQHALEGFTGSKGMMPSRGGNVSLSDEQVKAAVDYMTSQ
jgi:cytochrome c5